MFRRIVKQIQARGYQGLAPFVLHTTKLQTDTPQSLLTLLDLEDPTCTVSRTGTERASYAAGGGAVANSLLSGITDFSLSGPVPADVASAEIWVSLLTDTAGSADTTASAGSTCASGCARPSRRPVGINAFRSNV